MLCTQCGTELLRDDARFCHNCGATLVAQPQNPKTVSASASASISNPPPQAKPVEQQDKSKPSLREQVNLTPPSRPVRRPTSDEPPSWLSQLESGTRKPASEVLGKSRTEQPSNPPATRRAELPAQKPVERSEDQPALKRQEKPSNPPVPKPIEKPAEPIKVVVPGKPQPLSRSDIQQQTEGESAGQQEVSLSTLLEILKREELASPVVKEEPPKEVAKIDEIIEKPTISSPVAKAPGITLPPEPDISAKHTQLNIPNIPQPDSARPKTPVRELRVKVWESEKPAEPEKAPEEPEVKQPEPELEEADVEDLPTMPLVARSPSPGIVIQRASTPPPAPVVEEDESDLVERIDTMPLVAHTPARPVLQPPLSPMPQSAPEMQPSLLRQASPTSAFPPPVETEWPGRMGYPSAVRPPEPTVAQRPDFFSPPMPQSPMVQEERPVSSPPPVAAGPIRKTRRRSRGLVVFLVVLVIVIIAAGTGAWIVLFKPFTVNPTVEAQQSWRDTTLGLSLQYPSGWTVLTDDTKGTVSFSDSTHTNQLTIIVSTPSGTDLGQYLQQQATQLGLTGAKAGNPLTFAGVSWQQIQGTAQEADGVTNTETILAAVYNNRLYTITQLAPQQTYNEEDQVNFSVLRSSIQFI